MKIKPPKSIHLSNILPREPLLLMGAGPVPIAHEVARANGVIINHLGGTMVKVIERVKLMAGYVFQTKSSHIFGISGPASAAMEMGVSSVLEPGKKALILEMGTFGARFGEIAKGVGADIMVLTNELKPFELDQVKEILEKEHFDVLTIVQGETSCGIHNIHLEEITKYASSKGVIVIVDAVCTLTTLPFYMDAWSIDISITGGQKGLSSIPGVSLIAYSDRAWEVVEKRSTRNPHWCLDPRRADKFWNGHSYHYTAPVPGILAIHEALRLICDETLEKRFTRHLNSSKALQKGLEVMGLELLIPEEFRLNSVVAIKVPENIDSAPVLSYMRENYHVEISGAFGLNIVRIGQMGEQCRDQNLLKAFLATGMSFKKFGANLNVTKGMTFLEDYLVQHL